MGGDVTQRAIRRERLLECGAVRERIEAMLATIGRVATRHAWPTLVGTLLLIAAGATQIPSIEIHTSMDEFLPRGDGTRATYDAFLAEFGREDAILIAVEPPDVFTTDALERLRAFHEALEEEVPHLQDVQSLIDARETLGEDDTLIVGELLEDWPQDADDLARLRARALANPLIVDFLLSRDARLTVVVVELDAFADEDGADSAFSGWDEAPVETEATLRAGLSGEQEAAAVAAVNAVVERFDGPDFRLYAGGSPVLNTAMINALILNVLRFTALSTLLVAVMLALVLRRVAGVLIPMAVGLLSVVATVGAMGTFGIPAMPITEIVPSFLLSIGVGATVHLIAIFLQQLEQGATRTDAIEGALIHSGLPIVMTALTTAGGIASFATASLRPIAVFGLVGAVGILISLCVTLLLTPALLAIVPLRLPEAGADASRGPGPSIRALTSLGDLATRHAGRVVGAAFALVVLAGVGMLQLRMSFDSLEWFPDDMPAKVASYKIDERFGGVMALEVLVETEAPGGLHDPALLQALDRLRQTTDGLQVGDVVAGRSVSLADVVKEIHQALNEGRAEAYVVPDDRALVSQELILFENSGSDDLEEVVDTEFRVGRYSIRVPMGDALHYPRFGDEVQRLFDGALPEGANARRTGLVMVMGRTFAASIETLFRSYGIALAVISPLMVLLLGSLRLGLIAMIPNLFPIVLTLGLMGWMGEPLEMFSLLIGSIALGLAVDDTIHFMHGFRRRYAETGVVERAVRDTLATTGQALLFTSIVLTFGFLIYLFSELNNLTRFGLFTSFSIVMAFFADVLLAPALMKLLIRFSSLESRSAAASQPARS